MNKFSVFKQKKAFTLVELLAVIVVLVIILAITIPSVTSVINSAAKASFKSDAKMILKQVEYAKLENDDFDVATVTESTIPSFNLSNDNYEDLQVGVISGEIYIITVGQNKWDGLKACGTSRNMKVVPLSDTTTCQSFPVSVSVDTSGASAPVLPSNMIPIMYDGTNWVKADETNVEGTYSWYDYINKKWANAVTVTSATLSAYQSALVGTTVNESDILTYLVWIPRYKYAIPTGTGARTINVVFESGMPARSTGTAVGTNYLTHPAFTLGTEELNGIWVGKFETTGTISDITVKPNITSLRSQMVSSFYTAMRNVEASGNAYNFNSSEVDTHMILNSEWGAIAYLSYSIYGLNSEVYKNNSYSFITGISGGNVGGSQVKVSGNESTSTGFYTYDGKCATTTSLAPGIDANCTAAGSTVSDTLLSYKASTTGNIYGIYDMSGGAWDIVMGNYSNYSGNSSAYNSGFNGINGSDGSMTYGIAFPESKYYNLYTTNSDLTACNGGICYGQALSETSGWNSDNYIFVSSSYPWLGRGATSSFTTSSGIFTYCGDGGSNASTIVSTRLVVTMSE